ncbi:MAG: heavy-metal-associated domain-containing protein [Clostridia bacterium]|nr:heavy-metal-associated domain-containing protein [Clostridia bacterium]
MKELELKVEGMHCGGCENRVKNVLKAIDGVKDVEANHETGVVRITYKQDIDLNLVKEKIENLDFKVAD